MDFESEGKKPPQPLDGALDEPGRAVGETEPVEGGGTVDVAGDGGGPEEKNAGHVLHVLVSTVSPVPPPIAAES